MADESDRTFRAAFVVAVAFLAFVAGALATVADVAPAGYIRDAWRAGVALLEKRTIQANAFGTDLWYPAWTDRRGVTAYAPEKAAAGLTLYTSGHAPAAFLMRMDGTVVHRWRRTYSSIYDDSAAVRSPVPDRQTYFRKAHLYPDGDLLAIYIGVGDSPWGYGMVRLNRDSSVAWKNLDHFHHDFDVAADGRIYALTHRFRSDLPRLLGHLSTPILDDYLTIVAPDGRTIRKISLLKAMVESAFRDYLWVLPHGALGDPLHTNNVDILDVEDARRLRPKIPVAEMGQVLLSFRATGGGVIALLDVDEETIVWAAHGQWRSQHDPDILPNGNILMFDNLGEPDRGGESRVIEINPATGGIVWRFNGTKERPLQSVIRSSQQLLNNGNVLISESNKGRLLEVTRAGEVVWEYINPVRGGEEDEYIPVVSSGQRIDPRELTTAFRTLIQSEPLAKEGAMP